MRRTFKASEICAYIFGVLLAVVLVLVWPALMLTVDVSFKVCTLYSWIDNVRSQRSIVAVCETLDAPRVGVANVSILTLTALRKANASTDEWQVSESSDFNS